jgi:Fur family transcriptional regulator, stress-responsive regulator
MLRGATLRVTRPRVAVLSAVHDHPHADTDSIIGVVREDLGEVSHQAVYDVLRALTTAGLVRRFQPMGSVARYEARVGDNHHHVVCRSCGAIADVDCVVDYTPCLTAAEHSGYEIDEAEAIFWGRCPGCVAATSAASGGRSQARSARHQQSNTAMDPERPTSRATSHQKATATQEEDRRV